jgi:hypothetical protein
MSVQISPKKAKKKTAAKPAMKKLSREAFRILLVENIHSVAEATFRAGRARQVEAFAGSPSEEQLIRMIRMCIFVAYVQRRRSTTES